MKCPCAHAAATLAFKWSQPMFMSPCKYIDGNIWLWFVSNRQVCATEKKKKKKKTSGENVLNLSKYVELLPASISYSIAHIKNIDYICFKL